MAPWLHAPDAWLILISHTTAPLPQTDHIVSPNYAKLVKTLLNYMVSLIYIYSVKQCTYSRVDWDARVMLFFLRSG
ncbi:hypothetical protein DFH27DRAFT_550385 [Peziza echinospora]|nr:hypothetical protein DFH27DRAFT_550385 [Peziza echinospora]